MIRIYVVPTIPAWYSWYTPLSFASTAFCLGLLALLVFHDAGPANSDDQIIRKLMGFLMLFLFIETTSGFIHQIKLEKMNTGIDDLVFNQGPFYRVFLVRMGLLFITFSGGFPIHAQTGSVARKWQQCRPIHVIRVDYRPGINGSPVILFFVFQNWGLVCPVRFPGLIPGVMNLV